MGGMRRWMKLGVQLLNGSRNICTSGVSCRAKLIDGKRIAEDIQSELRRDINAWVNDGNRRPNLVAILVGEDPASATYVNNKMKAAQNVGISSKTEKFPGTLTQDNLIEIINNLNNNPDVDGILVQLPLPAHMNEKLICSTVQPYKDVDGFHVVNVGRLVLGEETLVPCTPLGVLELIKRSDIDTFGKNAVICGRSKNVGMPIAMMLHADGKDNKYHMDATTTICHRYTPDDQLRYFSKNADILVSATGIPGLIKKDMVKPGACIIDVGITRITDANTGKTRIVGDVDFEEVVEVAGHITPVPGGVGPMTVTMLMKNTFSAAKSMKKNKLQ